MNCQTIKKQHARRELLYHQKIPSDHSKGKMFINCYASTRPAVSNG